LKKSMEMKYLQKLFPLLLLVVLVSCKKNTEDYEPPTKGNVQSSFFVESTWNVQENTVFIPDDLDFCMQYLKKVYFGTQTCILTSQLSVEGKSAVKYEFKGSYRIENQNGNSTILYLDKLVHGSDTVSYKLVFDEINSSRSGMSLVLDLKEGTNLPAKQGNGNYGSFRLTK